MWLYHSHAGLGTRRDWPESLSVALSTHFMERRSTCGSQTKWFICVAHSALLRPTKSKLVAGLTGRLSGYQGERRRPRLSRPATRTRFMAKAAGGSSEGDVVLGGVKLRACYTREALDEGASLVIAASNPARRNVLACLRHNFQREIERKRRVIVEAIGVWDKDDVLPLYADPKFESGG